MRTYENKDELKNEINKSFAKYISEFDIIPESLKDKRVEEVDRTPEMCIRDRVNLLFRQNNSICFPESIFKTFLKCFLHIRLVLR